jgi:hypothetical protein
LLIAEPRPALRVGIEPMSVLVSGATTSEMPSPNVIRAGSTSMNTELGGISVDGFSNEAFHASDVAGSGPTTASPGP